MGELSVNINNDDSIFMEDQSVEKGDLVHTALVSNGYPSKFIKNIQAKKTRSSISNNCIPGGTCWFVFQNG